MTYNTHSRSHPNSKDFFSDLSNSGSGEQPRSPTIPSFIKQGPSGAKGAQNHPPLNAMLALDSLEPVLVGENSNGPMVNNPSPQSFMGMNKGPGNGFENSDGITSLDSEYATPQGDPQFVGLSQITYSGHTLNVKKQDIALCQKNDFTNTFIEQTLKTYYGQTNKEGIDSDQNGKKLKKQDSEALHECKQIQQFLQKARQNPANFSKVSFKVKLPFEMLLQQIQIHPSEKQGTERNQNRSPSQTDCFDDLARDINAEFESEQKEEKPVTFAQNVNMMNIVSNKTSANPSGFNSFIAGQPNSPPANDQFENKLQNVTFGKDVLLLSVSKNNYAEQNRGQNRNNVLIRSAFGPKVTQKHNVEINTADVVKEVTLTFLCATQAAENLFKSSSEPKVQNRVIDEKMSLEDESQEKVQKIDDPLDFGDLNDALQNDIDDEVALISRQHFDRQRKSKQKSVEKDEVDPEDIQFKLEDTSRDQRQREGSEEDDQFGDLDNFRMANMLNNDEEDDLRILDSLPTSYKPPELTIQTQNNIKKNNKQNQKGDTNTNINEINYEQQIKTEQQFPPLAQIIDKISIFGFNVNTIPAITNLTHFLNTSFFVKQHERASFEVDFLATVILITSKRATQAAEILRKLESDMVRRLRSNLQKLEKMNEINENSKGSCDSVYEHEIRTQSQDLFIRCAIFELLIADALSVETQLNEKIQALERMVAFSLGQIPANIRFAPQIMVSDDAFSALLRILPQLLRFCILSLTNKREIVKMSSLKILKFVFENQGCSLDFSMVYILKGMFLTYPTEQNRIENSQKERQDKDQNESKKQDNFEDDYPESPPANQGDDNKTCSSKFGKDGSFEKRDEIQNSKGHRVLIDDKEYQLEKLVGKAEANTLTIADFLFPAPNQQRGHKSLLSISHNQPVTQQTVEHMGGLESEESLYASRFSDLKEPKSGFQTALANVYSHVLDTLISVLSSISSHILHSIFYDVIEGGLTISQGQSGEEIQFLEAASKKSEMSPLSPARKRIKDTLKQQEKDQPMPDEIKVYACKIAEKIITICQGDLLISHQFLNSLLTVYSQGTKKTPDSIKKLGIDTSTTQGQQAFISIKNLWLSIRQKVFPHYSTAGYRLLIDWLSTRLSLLVHTKKPTSKELLSTKPKKEADSFPEELSDEEQIQLTQICDIISIVTLGRVKSEEEASQLIKLPPAESFGEGTSAEMYILLPQLIFWLEYSIDREDRLPLFQQLYSTIKKVVESSPKESKTQVSRLDIATIIMPSLLRTSSFLRHNSPSLPMLKFLDITLADFQLYLLEKRDLYRMAVKQNNMHLQGQTRSPVASSPSESMILGQTILKQEIEELQMFFLEFLENFVKSISYSLYEEVFVVFDRLLQLTGDMLSEKVLKQCIVALVDKYTLKSKQHKSSMNHFMKFLLDAKNRPRSSRKQTLSPSGMTDDVLSSDDADQKSYLGEVTFFEVMTDFCFFENLDTSYKKKSRAEQSENSRMERGSSQNQVDRGERKRMIDDRQEYNNLELSQLDFRGPLDMHEIFIDRLQFFIDSLSLMKEEHLGQFTTLITHPTFRDTLLRILDHGETAIRLKSFEILEALTAYFVQYCPSKTVYQMENDEVMDAEFISHERIYISQLVIQVVRRSLEQSHDCYLQFNALILLDFLFQNLLPVPTFMNEQLRARQQNRVTLSPDGTTSSGAAADPTKHQEAGSGVVLDIDAKISELTPELDVMDPIYLRMRMKLVLSLWGYIKNALSSPWSNIRSICYGLVCSMLKIKASDYPITETAGYATNDQRALSGFSNDRNNPVTNLSEILGDGAGLSDDLNPATSPDDCLDDKEDSHGKGQGSDKKEKNNANFQNNMAGGCVLFSDSDAVLSSDPTLSLQANLKVVLPMLYSLLSSKESESKAGGLNILGSFCGLSYDFSKVSIHQNLAFLQRNSKFVSLPIWRLVFQLQDDWDITIKEASVVLIQLCAPRNAILYFQSLKQKCQERKLAYLSEQRMNEINAIYGPVIQNFRQQPYTKSNQRLGRPESQLKLKNFLLNRSQGARRAFEQFPTRTDTQEILGIDASGDPHLWTQNESIDKSLFADVPPPTQPSLQEYLIGSYLNQVGISGSHPYEKVVTLAMIEQEHRVLAEKVRDFDPNYEDMRLTNQMSRRRQLEIELGVKRPQRKDSSESVSFFVDQYSDDQISEIISIFRNDFKPPKNLWIEKQPAPYMLSSGGINSSSMPQGGLGGAQGGGISGNQSPDYFGDIYAEAIEQFNQQQALMQEQQQAKLQQQVSAGSSSNGSESGNSNPTNMTNIDGPIVQQTDQKEFGGQETKASRISSQETSANYPNENQQDLNKVAVNLTKSQQQNESSNERNNMSQGKLGMIGGPRISPNLGGPVIDALEDQLVRECESQEVDLGGCNLERSPASTGNAHQTSYESSGSDKNSSQKKIAPQDNNKSKEEANNGQNVRPPPHSRKNPIHLANANAFSPSLIVELPKDDHKRHTKKQTTFDQKKISRDSKEALEKIIQVSKEQRKNSAEKQNQNHVPQKRLRRAKESQESLQFQQIMLDDIQIRPDLDRIGRSKNAEIVSSEEEPYEEVNFSEEQAFEDQQHMRSSEKGGSRLGQRSSRLHLQEELNPIHLNMHEGPQMAYHDDSYRSLEVHVANLRANRGVKGKNDRLLLSDQFDQASSSKADGNSLVAISVAEAAKTESRKKRRNQGGSKSFRSQEKKEQLHLIENDYFSPDDKLVAQLRNLTQKFNQQNVNKMYPQSIHVRDRSKDDSYRLNGKKKDLIGKKGTTSEELLRKQQMRQMNQTNSGKQSTQAFNNVRLMKSLEQGRVGGPRDDKNQLNNLVKEIIEGNLSPASKQRELINLDPTIFMKKIEKELNKKIRQQKEQNLSPQNLLKSIEQQLQELSREPGSGLSQAAAQAIAVKLATSVSRKDENVRNRSNSQGESKKRKKSVPPKLKLAGLANLYQQTPLNHDSTNNISTGTTPNHSSTANQSTNLKFMTKSHLNILRSSLNKLQKMNSSNQNNQSTTIGYTDEVYPYSSNGPKSKRSASNKEGRNRSAESRGSSRQPQRKKSGSLLSGQPHRQNHKGRASSNGSSNERMSGAIMPVKQMLLATNLQCLSSGGINQPPILLTERVPRQVGSAAHHNNTSSARKKKASSNEREEKSNTAGLLGKHLLSAGQMADTPGWTKSSKATGFHKKNSKSVTKGAISAMTTHNRQSSRGKQSSKSRGVIPNVSKLGSDPPIQMTKSRQGSESQQQQPSLLVYNQQMSVSSSGNQRNGALIVQGNEGEQRKNKSFSGIGGIPRGPSSANPKSKKIKQIVTSLQQQSQENGQSTSDTKLLLQILNGAQNGSASVRNTEFNTARDLLDGIGVNSSTSSQNTGSLGNSGAGLPNKKAMNSIFFQKKKQNDGQTISQVQMNKALLSPQNQSNSQSKKLGHTATNILFEVLQNQSGLTNLQQVGVPTSNATSGVHQSEKSLNSSSITGKSTGMGAKRKQLKSKDMSNLAINTASQGHTTANTSVTQLQKGSLTSRNIQMPRFEEAFQGKHGISPPISSRNKPKKSMKEKEGSAQRFMSKNSENLSPKIKKDPKLVGALIKLNM